ncbi:uncharacterized protein LOC119795895 isoform X2 [Cyprinodon tularosa]|uniref:uncharacterized protein LOC119795895 isoform X2 n=1 Tax=Cyprinodon tularosa TaxID=77115 RepID=UPI0018E2775F|nr:uncharacterized protein LOC119795895 isoform X2 [Cyprinodon tularosa]
METDLSMETLTQSNQTMSHRGATNEPKRILIIALLMLSLQVKATLSRNHVPSLIARVGDDITFSCENVISNHNKCDTTTWIHGNTDLSAAVELVELGERTDIRSDRLSVSENCSLVLKKISAEDVGRYTCRQFIAGEQSGPDAEVQLSVVSVTEHLDREKMTLTCSVLTQERCKHRVKWLFNGTDVKPETKIAEETSTSCSAAVTFNPTHYVKTTWSHLFKCEIKTGADKLQLFSLSPHPPGNNPTPPTTQSTPAVAELEKTENKVPADWWRLLVVSAGVVAVVAVVLVIVIRTGTKGSKMQMNQSNVHNDEDGDAENHVNIRMSEVYLTAPCLCQSH